MNCRNTPKVGSWFTHLNTLEKSTKIPEGHTFTKYHSCRRRAHNSLKFKNEKSHTPTDFMFPKLRFDTRSHKIKKKLTSRLPITMKLIFPETRQVVLMLRLKKIT